MGVCCPYGVMIQIRHHWKLFAELEAIFIFPVRVLLFDSVAPDKTRLRINATLVTFRHRRPSLWQHAKHRMPSLAKSQKVSLKNAKNALAPTKWL